MKKPRGRLERLLAEPLSGGDQKQLKKQRTAKFIELIELCGLSLNKSSDGWKLAVQLSLQFKGFHTKIPAGNKASPRGTIDDIILMSGFEFEMMEAKRENRIANERAIILGLAKANGWPIDKKSLETKRRRLQELKKPRSPERQRVVKLLHQNLPDIDARLRSPVHKK